MITAIDRVYAKKCRKPRMYNRLFGNYYTKWFEWQQSLPNEGDRIKITWFPDNGGEKNAYIGMEGIVESLNKSEGSFALNCETSILICHGDFNYIKL